MAVANLRLSSPVPSGGGPREQGVDVDEIILDRSPYVVLGDVALGAEVPTRRNRSQRLSIAIEEVRDADHRRL